MMSRIEIAPIDRDRRSSNDDDPEKKTCANVLCQENTFLVKRVC